MTGDGRGDIRIPGYQIEKQIFQSHRNTVFLALREKDQHPVCVKVLTQEYPSNRIRATAEVEHECLQRLRGVPGVVQVIDGFFVGHRFSIVTERAGDPLCHELFKQNDGSINFLKFCEVMIQVVEAVYQVHNAQLVHCDIKPGNLLYDTTHNQISLIDFDLAAPISENGSEAGHTKEVEGSLPYLSPEQTGRINRSPDYRTDFYSLGITIYELMTGKTPFTAEDEVDWIHAHLTQEATPLSEVNPNTPSQLSAMVAKLMRKDPDDRYQNIVSLKKDLLKLRDLLQGHGTDFEIATDDRSSVFTVSAKLYGRSAERAALRTNYRATLSGDKCISLLEGPPGSGKSVLAKELLQELARSKGNFIEGKFDQFQRDRPFSAFVSALEELSDQLLQMSEKKMAEWAEPFYKELGSNLRIICDLVSGFDRIFDCNRVDALEELPPSEAEMRLLGTLARFLSLTTEQNPLVLFIDDLQWADPSTLSLISRLFQDDSVSHLFLIGSFRNNEVDEGHPLSALIHKLEEMTEVQRLVMGPLQSDHIAELLADTLICQLDDVKSLAQVLFEKTAGSAFLVNAFLKDVHDDGHIWFDAENGTWAWNEDEIHLLEMSEGAADFLLKRLQKLPTESLELLQQASTLGARFELSVLAEMVKRPEREVGAKLLDCQRKGFVIGCSGPARLAQKLASADKVPQEQANEDTNAETAERIAFKFSHDLVQKAAQSGLNEEAQQLSHLQAARALAKECQKNPPRTGELGLSVASHFNTAGPRKEGSDLKQALTFNLLAGKRAASSFAHESAVLYLEAALELLGNDLWKEYETSFELQTQLVESLYLTGRLNDAEVALRDVLEHTRTPFEKAKVLLKAVFLYQYNRQHTKAYECTREGLALLGVSIPKTPKKHHIIPQMIRFEKKMKKSPLAEHLKSKPIEEPELLLASEFLTAVSPDAFITFGPQGTVFLSLVNLNLTYLKGINDFQCLPFGVYTSFNLNVLGRFEKGCELAAHALALAENYGVKTRHGTPAFFIHAHFQAHWRRPLREVQELYERAIEVGARFGDQFNANYALSYSVYDRFYAGEFLEQIQDQAKRAASSARMAQQTQLLEMDRVADACCQHLIGEDEADKIEVNAEGLGHGQVKFHAWLMAAWTYFFKGNLDAAQASLGPFSKIDLEEAMVSISFVDHAFLGRFITVWKVVNRESTLQGSEKKACLATLKKLKRSHELFPINHSHRYWLLSAIIHEATQNYWAAQNHYQRAIDSAKENSFLHYQALASLSLGLMLQRQKQGPIANSYISEAVSLFEYWGAKATAARLVTEYLPQSEAQKLGAGGAVSVTRRPFETTRRRQSVSTLHTTHREPELPSGDMSSLDTMMLARLSGVISEEIVYEKFVEKLVTLIMQTAGATRVALLLRENEELFLVSDTDRQSSNENDGSTEKQVLHEPADSSEDLCQPLLHLTLKKDQSQIVANASQHASLKSDPYVTRTSAKSVMCAPIHHMGAIKGLIYLENNKTADAFRADSLSLIEFIASQTGISIENARLYSELSQINAGLEKTVAERTSKLVQAQQELMEMSRQAGMSEVATSVLHNIGNILNSVNINSATLKDGIRSSVMGRFEKIFSLVESSGKAPAEFFKTDAKGPQAALYLLELGKQILEERKAWSKESEELEQGVNHIKEIVSAQQNLATVRSFEEEVALDQLVDSCIALQKDSFSRHNVKLVTDIEDLPPLLLDKSRLMQVIVNLISNAKDAVKIAEVPNETVTIKCYTNKSNELQIEVIDNGVGISADEINKVFSYGFTTKSDGHGFGLHHSANSVTEMGGKMEVHSDGHGKGAKFSVILPLKTAPTKKSA